MSETELPGRTKDEIDAWVAKTRAEVALLDVQRMRAEYEATISQNMALGAQIAADRELQRRDEELAADGLARTLRLHGEISAKTAVYVQAQMDEWRRLDEGAGSPTRPYRLILTSPGGSISDGLTMFDYLRAVDAEHPITTIAAGMCASMATVVIQAGSTRLTYPSTSWLIHRASWSAAGANHEIADTTKYVNLLQDRIFEILGERATVSIAQLKTKSNRQDWWFLGNEAVQMGLVDGIGI